MLIDHHDSVPEGPGFEILRKGNINISNHQENRGGAIRCLGPLKIMLLKDSAVVRIKDAIWWMDGTRLNEKLLESASKRGRSFIDASTSCYTKEWIGHGSGLGQSFGTINVQFRPVYTVYIPQNMKSRSIAQLGALLFHILSFHITFST
jgi:hypothetical protein